MKKLLLIMAVVGFVACNNKSDKKDGATDTTKMSTTDTTAKAPDTTAKMSTDTTKK
jgi:hypothetical protein